MYCRCVPDQPAGDRTGDGHPGAADQSLRAAGAPPGRRGPFPRLVPPQRDSTTAGPTLANHECAR